MGVSVVESACQRDIGVVSVQGFEHHINQEHHIWAYIFFFIHLNDTKQSDYTALELYVHRFVSIPYYYDCAINIITS